MEDRRKKGGGHGEKCGGSSNSRLTVSESQCSKARFKVHVRVRAMHRTQLCKNAAVLQAIPSSIFSQN